MAAKAKTGCGLEEVRTTSTATRARRNQMISPASPLRMQRICRMAAGRAGGRTNWLFLPGRSLYNQHLFHPLRIGLPQMNC
jgi:hypothetical protein